MHDYKKIGFKCGLEIHQQLETHKLFCNCPSIVHDENQPDMQFERRLRALAGESGEVDIAASYEQSKNKRFLYEACSSSSCQVELDEEPIHGVNREALKIALEIALLLKAKPLSKIQAMRKTVIDGSNVSGFQRTALIAVNGYLGTSKGKVGVPSICLEEEAAQKQEEAEGSRKFRLDRLGVALVEISTDASIQDPEHAKEAASIIGMILRSTGKVKRGIGTIRQDVNVSIAGKSRVEIKGFQDLRSIPVVIENEVSRQLKLEKTVPEVRKANPDGTTSFLRPMPGAARMYPETDIRIIEVSPEFLESITLPELFSERALRLEKSYQMNADLANAVARDCPELFERCVGIVGKEEANFVASMLTSMPTEIRRKHKLETDNIAEEDYLEVAAKLANREVPKDAVIEILTEMARGNAVDYGKFKSLPESDLREKLRQIVRENKGAPMGALMGEAMRHFRGKVDGKKIMDILKELTS